MRVNAVSWLLLAAFAFAAGDASAQRTMYRCNVNGQAMLSDRPCTTGAATGLASIGPTGESRTTASTAAPRRAVSYLDYLSPTCSELNEGMRNGPARGLGPRALAELYRGYRERCSDDDQAARKRFAEEQAKKSEQRKDELLAEKRERDEARVSREQCDEMYRIAHGRRKKLDTMSPGERADFAQFEANWKSRCPAP